MSSEATVSHSRVSRWSTSVRQPVWPWPRSTQSSTTPLMVSRLSTAIEPESKRSSEFELATNSTLALFPGGDTARPLGKNSSFSGGRTSSADAVQAAINKQPSALARRSGEDQDDREQEALATHADAAILMGWRFDHRGSG